MAIASSWLEAVRLGKAVPLVESPVLDVGCGRSPAFVPLAAAAIAGYVGVDVDLTPLRSSLAPDRVLTGLADLLPFRSGTFRTVLMTAVVEHVPDPEGCLKEVRRVLAPGGRVIVTTPTPVGDQLHHLLAKVGVTSQHAADEHQSIFSGPALKTLVARTGFSLVGHHYFMLGGNQICVARREADERRMGV